MLTIMMIIEYMKGGQYEWKVLNEYEFQYQYEWP